ncbi:2-hydroxyacid dehydrogenase [Maribacter hydrothermalis]|uniref:Phosphoglycerate dehydrogenase n=1 Tax=Maribacter hydrothermalis TaxID=1836467 RepID=A0A1B7ZEW6_9FLAO|nr:hydroxyacid dehydrogenase [Maribacter hydrothermalis]APQ17632.1 phosphoglycerate dehydrogenase [Maribacter hydrothermalis]OBR42107.1 phosphoglycerate dehydrogenase [Maribacter hydrothermalis]
MSKNVLLLETVADDALQMLKEASDMNILTGYDEASLQSQIQNNRIDAIITRGKGQVRDSLMQQLPELKVISRCGVGLDNIDVSHATKRGIKVVNAPNSNADTIAEHTIALLLMLQRNLYNAVTMVKENRWADRGTYIGDETHGKTLGIIGMGNIGKKVAKIATALGMNVVYWSSNKENVPYTFLEFDVLLKTSDSISLHLPLTSKTENLIDVSALSKMKPTALVINTARGGIIDQNELFNALKAKKIAGFAADVLALEPPDKNDPLVPLENVLITAHLGSLTKTTYTKMCTMTVENTLAILRDEAPMANCIFNREKLGIG